MTTSKRYIRTEKAPTPGSYSQAVAVSYVEGRLVLLSGQTGNVPGIEGEPVIEGGLGPQTTQSLKNILAIVEAARGRAENIIELKVFLKDSELTNKKERQLARTAAREAFNDAYVKFFAEHKRSSQEGNLPARTMLWVSEVPLEYPTEDTLVEITAMVVIPWESTRD